MNGAGGELPALRVLLGRQPGVAVEVINIVTEGVDVVWALHA
jgi:hypothetical protein